MNNLHKRFRCCAESRSMANGAPPRTPVAMLLIAMLVVAVGLAACLPASAPPTDARSTSTDTRTQKPPVATAGHGSITFGVDQEPPTLDPHASAFASTSYITSSIGESLLYLDEHHELRPWLADTWDVADGGATFTFKLRRDVVLQDGTPFKAAAVKWNFDRIVEPSYKAGTALNYLAGYLGTDILDDFTARVRFKQPSAPFLTYASAPSLAMLSPSATAQAGDDVNRKPVMSGPYRVEDWVSWDHLTLVRRDGYIRRLPWSDHDGPGYMDHIVWKFIPDGATRVTTVESGETQVVTVLTPRDADRLSREGFQVASTPWGGTAFNLYLNVTKAPTDDIAVRRAIAAALDPEPLLQNIYTGVRAISPLASNLLDDASLRENASTPNDARAEQLLDEGGWRTNGDSIRSRDGQFLTFTLNGVSDVAQATGGGPYQYIQGQLRQIGMDVTIRLQAQAAWLEDNAHCATNGITTGVRTNELDVLFALFHSSRVGANFNFTCVKDPTIDHLLERGRQEIDPVQRRQIYLETVRTVLDQALVIPLVEQTNVFALRSNVHGFKFTGYSYPVVSDLQLTP